MRRLITTAATTALAAATIASVQLVPTQSAGASTANPVCSSSGAAFRTLAFRPSPHSTSTFPGANDFATLSATGHGVWAGIEFNARTRYIYAITWRGGHRPTVLDRFHYANNVTYNTQTSVHMVGVDPAGRAVASVQPTQKTVTGAYRGRIGMYWSASGSRHYLSHAASWLSFEPTGVNAAGRIVGWAASGSRSMPTYSLVTWDHAYSHYRTLGTVGYDQPTAAIDAAGDIAYVKGNGTPAVRRPGGAVIELGRPAGTITSMGAGANGIYAATSHGVYRWDAAAGANSTPRLITGAAGGRASVDAVGSAGDVLVNSPGAPMLHTSHGHNVTLPTLGVYSAQGTSAVGGTGWTSYTSARDHRVHFMHCG